jgi:ketosteroid isomerase-like protein
MNELSDWYQKLTIESLEDITKFYAKDAFFKDPFNEIRGIGKIKHIFVDMFHQLQDPRFIFLDTIVQDEQAFITWDFHFSIKSKKYKIHGSSHLKLNELGQIVYHRDYWDVGEELFLKVPIIKNIYGLVRKKISAGK